MLIIRGLDFLVERIGRIISWFVILLILTMTYEVFSRYIFDSPTLWSFDVTYMLGAVFFLFSASYVLLHGGHVRVDLFYTRFSIKTKRIVDIVFIPLFFFTAYSVLTQQAWRAAFRALQVGETSMSGIWEPTTVPLRFIIALGFSLLLLQGVFWFLREIISVKSGKDLMEESSD